MIKSITIQKNKDSLLHKCWGNKTFEFTDGINILFGPNGCGKSVMLKTLSIHTSVSDYGGWSEAVSPLGHPLSPSFSTNREKITYPELVKTATERSVGLADVKWDGTPAYFSNITEKSSFQLLGDAMNGMTNELSLGEALSMNQAKLSSGQKTITHLMKLGDIKVPDLCLPGHEDKNTAWQQTGKWLSDYVKTLPRDGKPTLLLDEPDRSLDFENQWGFWDIVIPKLAMKYQIIIATHSPFVLNKDINVITQKDYYKKAQKIFLNTFAKVKEQI